MKILNFIKRNIMLILVLIVVIGLTIWSACIIANRDGTSAETTSTTQPGPLYKNIEPGEPLDVIIGPYKYYDVPLDKEIQDYIYEICDEYHVDRTFIFAMIERESNFDPNTIGDDGASYGLMQVQPYFHEDRMELLNCHDLLDPYQNIRVGVDYFNELLTMGKSIPWVLMAYNGGPSYANEMEEAGMVSDYVKDVLKIRAELKVICDAQ